jgi:F-type H+-transporting ATPase subunit delta
MAESVTIARPYAQAIFRLARDSKTLPAWSERLKRLALIAQDDEMVKIAGNPKFSAKQVADLVVSLSGEESDKEVASLVELLAVNERLTILPQIAEQFEELKSADEGVRDALVTSAYPLDDAQLKALMPELEAHFGARLAPRVEVDAELIGGIKVAVGDKVLDASVAGKLKAMAAALKN